MSQQLPFYGGSQPQLANPQSVQTPNVTSGAAQKALQSGQSVFDGALESFTRINDFGEQLRQQSDQRKAYSEFDVEFQRLSSLAPGSSGSLYDKDGALRPNAVQDLAYKYQQQINEGKYHYINPASVVQSDATRRQASDMLFDRGMGLAAKREIQTARQAFGENLQYAMANQHYGDAELLTDGAVDAGIISRTAGETQKIGIRRDALLFKAQQQLNEDPEAFWNDLDNDEGEYSDLPYADRKNLERMAAYTMQGFSSAKVRAIEKGTQSKQGGTSRGKSAADIVMSAPSNITKELYELWKKYNGDFKGDGRIDAMKHLAVQGRSMITNPDDPTEAETVKALYKAFGQSDDYANKMISQWQKDITRQKTFDPATTLDYASKAGYFTRTHDAYLAQVEQEKLDAVKKEGKKKGTVWTTERESQLLEQKRKRDAYITQNKASVMADLDIWMQKYRQDHDGEDPSELKIMDFVWESIIKSDKSNVTPGMAVDVLLQGGGETANAIRDRIPYWSQQREISIKADDIYQRRKNKEELHRIDTDANIRESSSGIDTDRQSAINSQIESILYIDRDKRSSARFGDNGSESVLYVPEGWYQNDSKAGVTTPNNRYAEATIVSRKDCQSPTMSKALRRQLGVMNINFDQISVTGQGRPVNQQNPSEKIRKPSGIGEYTSGTISASSLSPKLPKALQPYANAFVESGDKYGIDPSFLASIAMHETGNGTSSAFRNKKNAMGVSPNGGGPRSFNSIAESIDYMARQLRKNYLDKGLASIDAIGRKYAPIGASNDTNNSNSYWASGVTKNYRQF